MTVFDVMNFQSAADFKAKGFQMNIFIRQNKKELRNIVWKKDNMSKSFIREMVKNLSTNDIELFTIHADQDKFFNESDSGEIMRENDVKLKSHYFYETLCKKSKENIVDFLKTKSPNIGFVKIISKYIFPNNNENNTLDSTKNNKFGQNLKENIIKNQLNTAKKTQNNKPLFSEIQTMSGKGQKLTNNNFSDNDNLPPIGQYSDSFNKSCDFTI